MREIIDPDYYPDAIGERIGTLPDDHEWREIKEPRTGKIVKIPLPAEIVELVRAAECL